MSGATQFDALGGPVLGNLTDRTATYRGVGIPEKSFVVVVLVLSTTAFVNLFPGESGTEFQEQGILFAQILWAVLYAVLLFVTRRNFKAFVRPLWDNKLLLFLSAWAILSVTWSIDRQVTIRHFAALMLSSLFGAYFGLRYRFRDQLNLLLTSLCVVIAASVFACLVFPDYAVTIADASEGPSWQGVVAHRNTLGRLAVMATLILTIYFVRRIRRIAIVIGIVALFLVVSLTQSKTALVYFFLGIAAFPFIRGLQTKPEKRRKILLVAIACCLVVATWAYYQWGNFTSSLGRDPELTGRLALWALSFTFIAEKPFFGYGFDAFWSNFYGPAADFRVASGWLVAPHAHNGILNLWLDLGLIGVVLFLLGFAITCWRAVSFAKMTRSVECLWPVIFLAFFFTYSLTELSFLSRNELFWMLYVGVAVSLVPSSSSKTTECELEA